MRSVCINWCVLVCVYIDVCVLVCVYIVVCVCVCVVVVQHALLFPFWTTAAQQQHESETRSHCCCFCCCCCTRRPISPTSAHAWYAPWSPLSLSLCLTLSLSRQMGQLLCSSSRGQRESNSICPSGFVLNSLCLSLCVSPPLFLLLSHSPVVNHFIVIFQVQLFTMHTLFTIVINTQGATGFSHFN